MSGSLPLEFEPIVQEKIDPVIVKSVDLFDTADVIVGSETKCRPGATMEVGEGGSQTGPEIRALFSFADPLHENETDLEM